VGAWTASYPPRLALDHERAPESGEPGTVLVIDDDPAMLRSLARDLSGRSYAVEPYLTTAAAIARLAQGGVEAIMSDITMPDLSGIELLRLIRAQDAA
jgi:CheY-like chemotaxis protein